MGISSMHIQKASAGSILHNARENFSHSVVFTDEKNECDHNTKEAFEIYRSELAVRSEAYSDRTKQKLQKNALTQLSAIFNLEKHHTLADLAPLKRYIEKELDTVVYQIAIHKDEGKLVEKETKKELYSGKEFFKNPKDNILYFDKEYTQKIDMSEYNIEKNYHAHIEMMGLDSTGQAIKRNKLSKFQLSKMQTDVAKILEMERGVLGSKAKRRDTHQFKDHGSEQQKQKQTVSKLKQEIETLRKDMAEAKQFTKADYQALNKLKKSVKKATLEDAVEEFFLFKKRIEKEKDDLAREVYHPKYINLKTKEPLKNISLVKHFEKENAKLQNKLKNSSNQINEMKEKIKENATLKEELAEKKELVSVAVENQNIFREQAQSYQKKYLSVKAENTELKSSKQKVEYIENPIDVELKKENAELKKEVYSPKYITPDTKKPMKNSAMVAILERENAGLKEIEGKYNRLQKVVESINKLFKAETYEEMGEKVIAMFKKQELADEQKFDEMFKKVSAKTTFPKLK